MCFVIPRRVIARNGVFAVVEGNVTVDIADVTDLSVGEYVVVTEGIVVHRYSAADGEAMRSTIKQTYDTIVS